MKKVYNVEPERATWIQDKCITVCAENEEEALELVKGRFDKSQGKITVTEIDLTVSQVINVSNVGA